MTVKLKRMTSARPPVAVLAALSLEAESLAAHLKPSTRQTPQLTLWEGELEGKPVVLVLTGVGKVAAARATQFVCDRLAPRSIVNIGLAGGIESGGRQGRVIIASGALQHDYDARPIASARGVMPDLRMSVFPADAGIAAGLLRAAERSVPEPGLVRSGLVLTGDQIITTRQVRDRALAEFPEGSCFDMETAAVAQVAHLNGIPWGAVRITSDAADESFDMNEVLSFGMGTASDLFDRIVRAFLTGESR
jgi:adenosylhomocysteine nucleosidase